MPPLTASAPCHVDLWSNICLWAITVETANFYWYTVTAVFRMSLVSICFMRRCFAGWMKDFKNPGVLNFPVSGLTFVLVQSGCCQRRTEEVKIRDSLEEFIHCSCGVYTLHLYQSAMSIILQYPFDMRKKRGPKMKVYTEPPFQHISNYLPKYVSSMAQAT